MTQTISYWDRVTVELWQKRTLEFIIHKLNELNINDKPQSQRASTDHLKYLFPGENHNETKKQYNPDNDSDILEMQLECTKRTQKKSMSQKLRQLLLGCIGCAPKQYGDKDSWVIIKIDNIES